MENGLLYILAFSAMAIALFACILPQAPLYTEIVGIPTLEDEYTFVIGYNNPNYYATAQNGTIYFASTDITDTLQDCLDEGQGRILINILGLHTITRQIVMERGSQYISGIADASTATRSTYLYLTANVNASMFLINGTTNHDYYGISRMWLEGNSASQTAGSGIETTGSPLHLEFDHVQIEDFKQYGFSLTGGQILEMQSCGAMRCKQRGIYLQNWEYKSVVRQCWAFESPTNVYLGNVQDMEIYGLKAYNSTTYAGIMLDACKNIKFYGLDVELNYNEGVKFYGSQKISIYGGIIKNNGQQTNNTYPAVLFSPKSTTYSTYNNLYGLVIYSDTTKRHSYGIREADSNEDYNLIDGCVIYGSGTANVGLQGVNSIQDNVR